MVLGTALPGGNPRKFLFLEPNPLLEGTIAEVSALIKAILEKIPRLSLAQ
jgi:hypothetical protein